MVRGGTGIFFDRVGGDRIVYSVEQGNPYSATLDYNAFNNQSLANPFPALPVLGTFSSRYANFSPACQTNPATNFSVCNSNLNIPFLDEVLHTPLIRQYNLGIQYEFAPQWVLEAGYVGIELDQFDGHVPQQQHRAAGERHQPDQRHYDEYDGERFVPSAVSRLPGGRCARNGV